MMNFDLSFIIMKHMKKFFLSLAAAAIVITFTSCNKIVPEHTTQLAYTPGFNEFMLGIQTHHSKLWFAGQHHNWQLSEYEFSKLNEGLENLKKFCPEREEIKFLEILRPSLDSIDVAIKSKNGPLFEHAFVGVTKSCNTCHVTVHFAYNVIRIPETQPFSDQEYSAHGQE